MSILSTLKRLISSPAVAPIAAVLANDFDKAVIAAKQTEIGRAVVTAIRAAEQPGVSGAAKLEQAIAAVAPVVILYVAGGHLAPTLVEAETFARAVIESTLADIKKTGAASIAAMVLKLALAAAG